MNLWIVVLLLAICYGSETCDMKKVTAFVTKKPWIVLVLVLAFLWMSQRNEGLTSIDDCTWWPFGEDDSWGNTFCNGKCQWSSVCPACSDQTSSGDCTGMTGCTWDDTGTTCSDTPSAVYDATLIPGKCTEGTLVYTGNKEGTGSGNLNPGTTAEEFTSNCASACLNQSASLNTDSLPFKPVGFSVQLGMENDRETPGDTHIEDNTGRCYCNQQSSTTCDILSNSIPIDDDNQRYSAFDYTVSPSCEDYPCPSPRTVVATRDQTTFTVDTCCTAVVEDP